ncbi:hypothetical protein [uncultured Novosphingobium sp.]|nr:hypothetical protein [uncultured Novosphingobium sp.]
MRLERISGGWAIHGLPIPVEVTWGFVITSAVLLAANIYMFLN